MKPELPNAHKFSRRSLLVGAATTGSFAAFSDPAFAAPSTPTWMHSIATNYLDTTAELEVTPLQDGMLLLVAPDGGYAIADSDNKAILEFSTTGNNPFNGAAGDLVYLGPGFYFQRFAGVARNLLTRETTPPPELTSMARDYRQMAFDTAEVLPISKNFSSRHTTAPGVSPLNKAGVTPVIPGQIRKRVTSYCLITTSRV